MMFEVVTMFSIIFLIAGEKITLEIRNCLLELLSYDGVGNDTMVANRSKFIEHQRLLNNVKDLEFIPTNPSSPKSLAL